MAINIPIRVVGSGKSLRDIERLGARGDKALRRIAKGAKPAGAGLRAVGAAAGFLKTAIVGVGFLAFTAGAAAALEKTIEFTSTISNLSAITGATGEDLALLSQNALDLARDFGLGASAIAEGEKLIASAKPELLESAAALAAVTEQAVILSKASGDELPESARSLAVALNQFREPAATAGRFINVLAAASKFGAAEIPFLTAALKDSGTIASGANISFEETVAVIELLAKAGLPAEQAGTGLRNVFLELQASADEFNPAIVGLNQALKNMAAEQLTVTELMEKFGKRSVIVANELFRNVDAFETLTGKITGTQTALEQARINMDNLGGDLDKLSAAFEVLSITVGTQATFLRDLVQAVTAATNAIKDNLPLVGNLALGIGALGVAKVASIAIAALAARTATSSGAFRAMAAGASASTVRLLALGTRANIATIAVRGLSRAMKFLGGPVGIAILAAEAVLLFGDEMSSAAQAADAYTEALKLVEEATKDVETAQRDGALQQEDTTRKFIAGALTLERLEAARLERIATSGGFQGLDSGRRKEAEASAARVRELEAALEKLDLSRRFFPDDFFLGSTAAPEAEARIRAFRAAVKDVGVVFDQTRTSVEKINKEMAELVKLSKEPDLDGGLVLGADLFARRMAQLEKRLAAATKAVKKPLTEAEKAFKALKREALATFEATRTPLEQLQARLAEINELATTLGENGIALIDEETAERARDAARKTFEDMTKEAEKAATEMDVIFNRFGERVFDSFADTFRDIFDNGIDGFRGFFNRILDLGKDLAAQIATLLIFRPQVLGAAGGLGGFLDSFFGGGAAPAAGAAGGNLLGTAGAGALGGGLASQTGISGAINAFGESIGAPFLSSILGAASLGAIGGNLLGGLTGLNKTGSTIGGGVGATAGFILSIGNPVVAAIAGAIGSLIGGALGSLFSSSPKVQLRTAAGRTGFEEDIFAISPFGNVGLDPASKKQSDEFRRQFADQIASIDEALASFLTAGEIENVAAALQSEIARKVKVGKKFEDDELFDILKDRFSVVIDTVVGVGAAAKAFAGIGRDNPDQLAQIAETVLQFNKLLTDFGNDNEPLTQAEQAIAAINAQFDELAALATRLGFAEGALIDARAKALRELTAGFDDAIQLQILNITDPLRAAEEALFEAQKQRLREAIALGADLDAVAVLNEAEFAALRARRSDPAAQLLFDLTSTNASTLAAGQVFANAQSAFEDIAGLVRSGGAFDAGALSDLARNFIDVSRQQFGSSETFFRLQDEVLEILRLAAANDSGLGPPTAADIGAAVADGLTPSLDAIGAESAEVNIGLGDIRDELTLMRADISEAFGDIMLLAKQIQTDRAA